MLLALLALGAILNGLVALWLYREVAAGQRLVRRSLGAGHPYLRELGGRLAAFVDEELVTARGGLGRLEVRYRDHLDPYRTVDDLLGELARLGRPDETLPAAPILKATYQLSYTLGLPPGRVESCVALLLEEIKSGSLGRPAARVRTVFPGELVDARAMEALNYGTRVLYPLGVVTYDDKGVVLARAPVICC